MTDSETAEMLYHIKRTITDFAEDKSGATRTVDILGTYTDLKTAKEAARTALLKEGYLADDFETYAENNNDENWKHGDGVRVYAKAPAGQEFEVRLDTKPNTLNMKSNAQGMVEGPLHYVLETIINYNNDRIGGIQCTEVEGTFLTRQAARDAARTTLLDDGIKKESFAEYDEFDDARDVNEWPYGDDVLVHAVSETGENFLVSVKAQPHSHKEHAHKEAHKQAL